MEEVRIRGSRRVAAITLVVGCVGLAAVGAIDLLRKPFTVAVFVVAVLVGGLSLLDRRVKLFLSSAGVRYARWGPSTLPWHEFTSFRWATWRGQPYLQLLVRRPSHLVTTFSPLGKLNYYSSRLLRIPPFSIATIPLEVTPAVLAELIARHLPEAPSSRKRR